MKKYVSPFLAIEELMNIDVMAASGNNGQDDDATLNEDPVDFGKLQGKGVFSRYYQ